MTENPLAKRFPIVVFVTNLIISGITSGIGAPLPVIPGLMIYSVVAALIGAGVGFYLALSTRPSRRTIYVIVSAIASIITLVSYGALSSASGAGHFKLYVILAVYASFYIAAGYILTSIEIALKDWVEQQRPRRPPPHP